jgi:hypothetical protein
MQTHTHTIQTNKNNLYHPTITHSLKSFHKYQFFSHSMNRLSRGGGSFRGRGGYKFQGGPAPSSAAGSVVNVAQPSNDINSAPNDTASINLSKPSNYKVKSFVELMQCKKNAQQNMSSDMNELKQDIQKAQQNTSSNQSEEPVSVSELSNVFQEFKKYLTPYQIKFAKSLGATEDDLIGMGLDKHFENQKNISKQLDKEETNHELSCGCKQCESDLFAGEADENNDGGAQVLQEWKKNVIQARLEKAKCDLEASERFVVDFLKAQNKFQDFMKKKQEYWETLKKNYVHVNGTSSWLKYGIVTDSLRSSLVKLPGVEIVDTLTYEDGRIMCRIYVKWPFPSMNDLQREEHFRQFLSLMKFENADESNVVIVGAADANNILTQQNDNSEWFLARQDKTGASDFASIFDNGPGQTNQKRKIYQVNNISESIKQTFKPRRKVI